MNTTYYSISAEDAMRLGQELINAGRAVNASPLTGAYTFTEQKTVENMACDVKIPIKFHVEKKL